MINVLVNVSSTCINYPGKEALQGIYILNQKRKMNLNEKKNTKNYN